MHPLGAERFEGESYVYQMDDYGSALLRTHTIDLYRPSKASMNHWGARFVNIKVLKWGAFDQSLAIMKPRVGIKPRIRQMVSAIETRSPSRIGMQ